MKKAIFHLKRDSYQELTTLGKWLNPDGTLFGYTLEDVVRPLGIKDKHYTAIPETQGDFTYQIETRDSSKYGHVVVIFTEKEKLSNGTIKYILEYGGVRFEYILAHGGNTHKHTSGCVLVARNRNSRTIQGSLKTELANEVDRLIDLGYDVRLRVTNLPQCE